MDTTDFYTLETPPSSSSKDSADESTSFHQSHINNFKFSKPNNVHIYSTSTSNLSKIEIRNRDDEFGCSLYSDMHTPLRRVLGNTKLKTRQDVRRFRKFLKRNYDLLSMTLVDIDPDTMRKYLIDYLTSIRTRKGLKYDPETLRSYYLSIQRYLKDSNYPYCLRNSPQFAECRDLIVQMRKEKTQIKTNDLLLSKSIDPKKKRTTKRKSSPIRGTDQIPVAKNDDVQARIEFNDHSNLSDPLLLTGSNTSLALTKNRLPSSSLPPRKRQEMKYFLEFSSPSDYVLPSKLPSPPSSSLDLCLSPTISLASYLLLVKFTRSLTLNSSSHHHTLYLEQLLDESPNCGHDQRLMLTTLCREWTGDIRLIHNNLRPELSSFLPHILILNIFSSKDY